MPSPYPSERYRRQTATYWAPSGRTSGYARLTFADPSGIRVRWRSKSERFLTLKGEEAVSRAVVTLGEEVKVGGFLYLGTSASGDPRDQRGAYEIRQVTESVDALDRHVARRAFL